MFGDSVIFIYLLIQVSGLLFFFPQKYQKQRKLLRKDWFWRHSYWSLWILMHQFFMLPFLKEGRINILYMYIYFCLCNFIYVSVLVDLCLKMGTKIWDWSSLPALKKYHWQGYLKLIILLSFKKPCCYYNECLQAWTFHSLANFPWIIIQQRKAFLFHLKLQNFFFYYFLIILHYSPVSY